jgi:putative DNA primase/helicase
MGTYAQAADFELFLKKPNGRGIPNDLAALREARMVSAVEVDPGRELAGGLVKQVTGGDTVSARFLFKEYFQFKPQFKIVFVANDAPVFDAVDSGMVRRIRVIPFDHAVARDRQAPYVKALVTDRDLLGPAVLAWMVQGCLLWQTEGLGTAEAVEAATSDLRKSMDDLGIFIEECCVTGAAEHVMSLKIFQVYREWAYANGKPIPSDKALTAGLRKKGFEPKKKEGQRGWQVWVSTSGPLQAGRVNRPS